MREESRPEHRERPNRTRRGAPQGATRHAREPRHTDRCQAATAAGCREHGERARHTTNPGRGTSAKQHQLPFRRTCARPAANPAPASYGTAAVRMDECAPRGYPALPATNSHRTDGRVSAPQLRPADATHSTTHRASTPMDRSQVAQDTAPHTGRAHRSTRAKEPRTPHTQDNTPSGHTGEQEPRGPGHRTSKTTHQAGTPVNRGQVSQDSANTRKAPSGHIGEAEPSGPGLRTGRQHT